MSKKPSKAKRSPARKPAAKQRRIPRDAAGHPLLFDPRRGEPTIPSRPLPAKERARIEARRREGVRLARERREAAGMLYLLYLLGVFSGQKAAPVPPDPNAAFLAKVRAQSCYRTLRDLHGTLASLAILACIGFTIFLCANAPTGAAGAVIFATGALCTVGLLIEQWLFTLIVDAVDVLIEGTRRRVEGG